MSHNNYKFSSRSIKELKGVHEDLIAVTKLALTYSGCDFAVFDGMRTVEEQRENVRSGASQTMNSRHLTGHAVDLVPYVDGRLIWSWKYCYMIADAMQKAANELGVTIRWGGVWDKRLHELENKKDEVFEYTQRRKAQGKNAFTDGPHFELPEDIYG